MNRTTRITTTVSAMMLALAGFEHGLFEALQGNKPTNGLFIQAIGDSVKWWKYGTEDAFTIVPNFMATGVLAMSASTVIVIWSLFFLRKEHAARVLLLLFILLTLVGGGVGFIPFYLVTCAYASRMTSPLNWWRKVLPQRSRREVAAAWSPALIAATASWLIGLEIAIWGYIPGQFSAEATLNICWGFLLLAMVFINLTFVSGFARDIEVGEPAQARLRQEAYSSPQVGAD